ncbi:uncharacterized protein LOC130711822 [Lotus japonicus]|uniref:uncharacterized protein LOC130711822 n=1 Tax=Lotus japonicus TaxID=34305 RepID=UPI0025845B90|nr:uncharacterized protein LOC130711822 [Lotus japonicus]
MACLDMYNNSEHKGHHHHHQQYQYPVSPRISFANDFVDAKQASKQERSFRSDASVPVSSDFEFSVSNYNMMSADELFSKGRLLPFKDGGCNNQVQRPTTTLREELMVDDDEFSLRPPKGSSSTRWKGFLGLRKSHIGSKKVDKSEGSSNRGVQAARSGLSNMTSQDLLIEGGSSCRDVEFGI